MHYSARSTTSPIEHDIEKFARLPSTKPSIEDSSLKCTPQQMKHTIKETLLQQGHRTKQNHHNGAQKLSIHPIVQIYYIFKPVLNFLIFARQSNPNPQNTAKVIPIAKQGKPATAIECYRPISLLSTTSKLFEKIIIIHLLIHVNNSNIIIP